MVAYGLGPIGCRLAARLLARPGLRLVGAVDIDPAKVGRSLEDVLGTDSPTGIIVTDALRRAVGGGRGGVVVHATGSRVRQVAPQLAAVAAAGWNVVSTCEELVYPQIADAALAEELDRTARRYGVTMLGSGINPGFLLDSLVLVLTGACTRVDAVTVQRTVDTNQRRAPLQRKAGVGLTEAEFRHRADLGAIGHVGLSQSAHLVAQRLGWELTSYRETIDPVLAEQVTQTGLGAVEAGGVLGQRQTAVARVGDREVLRYVQLMAAGQPSSDVIDIAGEPPVHQRIEPGVNGDVGTEAVVSNLVVPVAEARPGLLTMADVLPLACAST